MSKSKRREKAARRQAEYLKHGAAQQSRCLKCEQLGSHFVPPSFGDKGFYICDPDAKLEPSRTPPNYLVP